MHEYEQNIIELGKPNNYYWETFNKHIFFVYLIASMGFFIASNFFVLSYINIFIKAVRYEIIILSNVTFCMNVFFLHFIATALILCTKLCVFLFLIWQIWSKLLSSFKFIIGQIYQKGRRHCQCSYKVGWGHVYLRFFLKQKIEMIQFLKGRAAAYNAQTCSPKMQQIHFIIFFGYSGMTFLTFSLE